MGRGQIPVAEPLWPLNGSGPALGGGPARRLVGEKANLPRRNSAEAPPETPGFPRGRLPDPARVTITAKFVHTGKGGWGQESPRLSGVSPHYANSTLPAASATQ